MAERELQEQLAARGLELLGSCDRLSQRPGLMEQSALLRDFTPAEADLLGANMQLVRARPGQLLIAEDEASDWMMLLLRGTVDVGKRRIAASDTDEASEVTRLAVLKEGATLGEMSMLDGEPRYASCWALSEVEAAVLSRVAVGRLITSQPAVGAKLLVKITQLLAQRLRNTSSQLVKAIQKAAEPPPA
ncbi:Crp/Fnr family transcriptional regulator [Caenimonas aquaedulcis]|nr:cyclic nucleotide-binding domain-containing protein [Caenimonas aquaedulcis]